MTAPSPLTIIVDTREQRPYLFRRFAGVTTVRATLHTGDYSVLGAESRIAVERKSLSDFIGCINSPKKDVKAARPKALIGRDRFEAELARARELDLFWVVIEATEQDVLDHKYRSRIHPNSVLGSVRAWSERYNVRFVWAVNRRGAEGVVCDLLRQWAQDQARTAQEELFG